jgi:hypothetical protein
MNYRSSSIRLLVALVILVPVLGLAQEQPYTFKGLAPGLNVSELIDSGYLDCEPKRGSSRTKLCIATRRMLASKYGSLVGFKVNFMMLHLLDNKITRLYIKPEYYRDNAGEVMAKLERAFVGKYGPSGPPVGRGQDSTELWVTECNLLCDTPFKHWRHEGQHMLIGEFQPSRMVSISDNVFQRYTFLVNRDPEEPRMSVWNDVRLVLLLVSEDHKTASQVYRQQRDEARANAEQLRRQRQLDDI